MRQNTTEVPAVPAHSAVRFRWLVLRWGVGVSVLLALIVLFEVGIRHMPPDGMTVTETGYAGFSGYDVDTSYTFAYSYNAPQDQQTISATYTSLNTAPVTLFPILSPQGCLSALTRYPYPTSIAFTWHGIPLETWSTGGCVVGDAAGGIPAFWLTGHYWVPDGPFPPPALK